LALSTSYLWALAIFVFFEYRFRMETFTASVEAALWLEDVLDSFAKGTPQTPLLIDDEGSSHEIPAELVPIFKRLATYFKNGKPVSIITHEQIMTTQQAADFIGVSRPTLVMLLEKYKIPHRIIGSHRRIDFLAVQSLQVQMKDAQRKALTQIRKEEQLAGMYDEYF